MQALRAGRAGGRQSASGVSPSDLAGACLLYCESPSMAGEEDNMDFGAMLAPAPPSAKFVDDTSRGLNEVLLGATTFRFDGSDLMPGAIGAGAFWTGMVDYAGGTPAAEVAAGVQNAWDAVK